MHSLEGVRLVHTMDRVASSLENRGLIKEAEELDAATNRLEESVKDPKRAVFQYDTIKNNPDLLRTIPRDIVSLMESLEREDLNPSFMWIDIASVSFETEDMSAQTIKALASVQSLIEVGRDERQHLGSWAHRGYDAAIQAKRTPEFEQAASAVLQNMLKGKQYKKFDPSI